MNDHEFTVHGDPVPWQRTGLSSRRGFYTPAATRNYEQLVADLARIAKYRAKARTITGPVALTMRFFRASARPCDIDNLAKAIQDALNGVSFKDDSQVVWSLSVKTIDPDDPRVEVEVRELPVDAWPAAKRKRVRRRSRKK